MGLYFSVDSTGNLVGQSSTLIGPSIALSYNTGVLTAALTISGVSIIAGGTDANIDINITPKGIGSVVISNVDINGGAIDSTILGGAVPAAGTFTTLTGTTSILGVATANSVALRDLDASNVLTLTWNEDDVADRALQLGVNGASHSVIFGADLNLDQDLNTSSAVTFGSITAPIFTFGAVTGILQATAGVVSAGTVTLDQINDGATYGRVLITSLSGNEVVKLTDAAGFDLTVDLSAGDRVLTMNGNASLNQDVRTTASPTFAGITVSGLATDGLVTITTGVLGSVANSLDNINDGATYGKVLNTSLSSNEVTKLTDASGDDLLCSLGGANRTLTLAASVALNQNLQTSDSPTFTGLTVSGGAINDLVIEDTDSDTDDVLSTGITSGYGLLVVSETTGTEACVFLIAGATIEKISADATFTVTKDTASSYNVYWETDQFKVQNKVGDDKYIKVALYGTA